jgi:hypothetical protein
MVNCREEIQVKEQQAGRFLSPFFLPTQASGGWLALYRRLIFMMIDRLELLKAIGFLKHVIPDEEATGKSCVFVRVEDDKLIMVGGGQFATKKAVLVRPNTTEEAAQPSKKKPPESFMIPIGTLLSFETLMSKHKKKAKKQSKTDPSYLYVDIDHKELESFGVSLAYQQPSFDYKHLEGLFSGKRDQISNISILPGEMESVSKGFKKAEPVEVSFMDDGKSLHFRQESNSYEAHLIKQDALVKQDDEQTEG